MPIDARTPIFWPPVLGISGLAQSGKTTLLEALLLALGQRGIKALTVKSYGNELSLEDSQSDSARLYRHGADSFLHDNNQILLHQHHKHALGMALQMMPGYYDIILVEGHRSAPIPKFWVKSFQNQIDSIPDDPYIRATIDSTPDREQVALQHLNTWLTQSWQSLPVAVAIVGNWEPWQPPIQEKFAKMLALTIKKCTMFASEVILIGSHPIFECSAIPQMPFMPKMPLWLAAFVSAFRWSAQYRWLFVPPDWSIVDDPFFPLDTLCLNPPECLNPPPCNWAVDFHIPTPLSADMSYGLVYPNTYYLWQQILTEFIGDPVQEWWYPKLATFELGRRLLSLVQIVRA